MSVARRVDLLAGPSRRAWLFAGLYFLEGAPIGFLWWTLPVLLRRAGRDVEAIGALLALLALPWSAKVVIGPLVDLGRGPRWTERGWIVAAQFVMAASLLPLLFGDAEPSGLVPWLLLHAAAAATQDVAIDALAVRSTTAAERGRLNAAMNAGMLSGRALFGAGAVWVLARGGERAADVVLAALFALILVAGTLLAACYRPRPAPAPTRARARELLAGLGGVLASRRTWRLAGFALLGGAGFEGLGALLGPFVLDQGASESQLAVFYAAPAWLAPLFGGFVGARLARRLGKIRGLVICSLALALLVALVAALARLEAHPGALFGGLAGVYFAIGGFTAVSYALFMDASPAAIGSTMFTAYMGMTNLCESWSAAAAGSLASRFGYPAAFAGLAGVSLCALILLPRATRGPSAENGEDRGAAKGTAHGH